MKTRNNLILITILLAVVAFVFLAPRRMVPIAQIERTVVAPLDCSIEYTKNGELAPPIHVKNAVSIHIITDADDKIKDIQVFPLPNADTLEARRF